MDKEIYKASIQYHIKQMVGEAVLFVGVLILIYYSMFNYEPGWFWIVKNCALIVLLYLCGRDYKKEKVKVNKALDKILNLN